MKKKPKEWRATPTSRTNLIILENRWRKSYQLIGRTRYKHLFVPQMKIPYFHAAHTTSTRHFYPPWRLFGSMPTSGRHRPIKFHQYGIWFLFIPRSPWKLLKCDRHTYMKPAHKRHLNKTNLLSYLWDWGIIVPVPVSLCFVLMSHNSHATWDNQLAMGNSMDSLFLGEKRAHSEQFWAKEIPFGMRANTSSVTCGLWASNVHVSFWII